MADKDTRMVEFSCLHRDIVTKPLNSDWRGTSSLCDVCQRVRKIVWTDRDD